MYQVVNAGGVSKILYRNDSNETWTELYTETEIVAVNEAKILSAVPEVITPLEPRCKKTGLRGFRPDPTQIGLHSPAHTKIKAPMWRKQRRWSAAQYAKSRFLTTRLNYDNTIHVYCDFHDRNISNFQIKLSSVELRVCYGNMKINPSNICFVLFRFG